MPARSSACWPTLAIAKDAQRNTALPCMTRCGIAGVSLASTSRQSSRCRIRSNCSPSEPQTTGPMPGVSLGPTTAAPAPSAKMKAVPRSWRSVMSVSRSTPITSTCLALPRADHVAGQATPWQKPGAGGGDVEGRRLVGAELVRDRGGDRRGLQHVGDGRDDHAVDLARRRCRRARAPRARRRPTSSGRSPPARRSDAA